MIKKILIFMLFSLSILILGITFLLQTDHVKKLVQMEISSVIEKQIGSPITIQGLHLEFPLIAEVETISSQQFTLHHARIKCSVWNFLRGDIVIRKLTLDNLEIAPVRSTNVNFSISTLPSFHIDFFSIKTLRYLDNTCSIEGEIHSGEVFSASLIINLKDNLHPFHCAINGMEIDRGITAQFLLKQQEDFFEGTFTLADQKKAFESLIFIIKGVSGEGNIYLSDKNEWDGTELLISSKQSIKGLLKVSLSSNFFTPHFKITGSNVSFQDFPLEDNSFEVSGQWKEDHVKGKIQAHYSHELFPSDLSSHFIWNHNEELQLHSMQLYTSDFSGTGQCAIDLVKHQIRGQWNGKIPRYEVFCDLAMGWTPEKDQWAQLSATSQGFSYEDTPLSQLLLTATLTNVFETPKGTVRLLCEQCGAFNQLSLESSFDLSQSAYPFNFSSRFWEKGYSQVQGEWDFHTLKIANCLGEILDYPFNLKDPFVIAFDSGSFKTTPFNIYLGDGALSIELEKNKEELHVQADIKKLPLQLLQLIPSLPRLRGDADGSLDLLRSKGNLTGSLNIDLDDVEILEDIQPALPPFHAKLKTLFSEQGLTCNGEITGQNLNPIRLSGFLKDEQIGLHFEAKDEITQFMQLLFFQNAVHMTGEASVFLDMSGTLLHPEINGEVIWTQGTFEHPETGILYKNISGKLTATGSQLILNSIEATDVEGGTLTGSGSMLLSTALFNPFSIDLQVKETNLLDLDYASAKGNGTLNLSGNIKEAFLKGTIQADSIKIRIPDKSRPSIPSIAVNYTNQSPDDPQPTSAYRPPSPWPIRLDLACEILNPISIKGKNLHSTWNGRLQVKGSVNEPLLYGDFKALTGEYNFRGKIFDIKEGSIFFSGEKGTSLYVVGRQDIDDMQAEVILKGPLKSPALSFRSNPPMPQREIVSYILFGYSSSELTSFQGTELSESITDLHTTQKPDLLTRLGEKIGIDKIDISSSDVKVGKYISKGVLISIDKSMSAEANHVSLEAKVMKDIKFEGQIGDDAEGQLNIKWKKDY